MTDGAWISKAFIDPDLIYAFGDKVSLDGDKEAREQVGMVTFLNGQGESVPAEQFPKELYVFRTSEFDPAPVYKDLPDFFRSGFFVVSGAFADVLRQFDLGGGGVYPTKLFQEDRTTEITGDFHCLNFGNKKEAFLPEHSPRATAVRLSTRQMQPPAVIKDGDIAVSGIALEGPDIWIDPILRNSFFMSDRLWQGLVAANVQKPLKAARCKVIG